MSLKIPQNGLILDAPVLSRLGPTMPNFAIDLSDGVLESMIECVKKGKTIELSLGGDTPTFLYGDQQYAIQPVSDDLIYDLYSSKTMSSKSATRLAQPAVSLSRKQVKKTKCLMDPHLHNNQAHEARSSAGVDNTAVRPQSHDFASNLKNNASKAVKTKPVSKSKPLDLRATTSSKTAMASSGASSLPSPSNSTNKAAQDKRWALVHELAVKGLPYQELEPHWPGPKEDFRAALDKVAEFDKNLQVYVLTNLRYKELDVYQYPYRSEEDRQKAIDNAVKRYDRMRFGPADPLWQKLLPEKERGKGKCLSKLLAPKPNETHQDPKVQKTNGTEGINGNGHAAGKAKGGEPMARSNSQMAATKKKNNKHLTLGKRFPPKSKPLPAKPSPKVAPANTAERNSVKDREHKFLSKEFVIDSEDSSDEAPLAATVAKSRLAEKEPAKTLANSASEVEKAKNAAPKSKPARKTLPKDPASTTKASQSIKRPRNDDEVSVGSHGSPSKRCKGNGPVVRAPTKSSAAVKQRRASDAGPKEQRLVGAAASRTKTATATTTTPSKSSPLTSPPTNASDLSSKKRKTEPGEGAAPAKRQCLSPELLTKAQLFRKDYGRYATLHQQMASMKDPPKEQLASLHEMHERLSTLKSEIYSLVAPV